MKQLHGLLKHPQGLLRHPHGLLKQPHGLLRHPHGLLRHPHGLLKLPHGLLKQPHSWLKVPPECVWGISVITTLLSKIWSAPHLSFHYFFQMFIANPCCSTSRSLSVSGIGFFFRGKGRAKKLLFIPTLILPALLLPLLACAQDTARLPSITITGSRIAEDNVNLLNGTSGTTIYAGKKNEIINLKNLPVNTAANSSRQIYAQVPGVNIIENDEAGVQLGIATRGLNPNRTTAFNSRQNGYDISADPIGYPETYYTPPADGLASIEIIRGAASLQYGTQFGGLLNFRFKEGPADKKLEINTRQTGGSYGFFSSFNSVGGTVGKLNYYGFYNYRQADGWRQNTGFDAHNAYAALSYALSPKVKLGLQYSLMQHDAQQPGGLSDKAFAKDPRQSLRNRNFFTATWHIPALSLDVAFNKNNLLSTRVYGLIASRKYVGVLSKTLLPDPPTDPRTVMADDYRNAYAELRFIHHYTLLKNHRSSLATGLRLYHGNTHRTQGYTYSNAGPDFAIAPTENLQIDYNFPSWNAAAFAENLFQLSQKLSITPGIRYEYIQTNGNGYTSPDTSNPHRLAGRERHTRNFPLLGIGLDYKATRHTDLYANISQNYSPVNFGDIVVISPGMKVDPNLQDVKGYNADLGYRGKLGQLVHFDLSAYYLLYKNRVGTLLQTDGGTDVYQYTTNIADSRSLGAELFADVNLAKLLLHHAGGRLHINLFASTAFTSARYIYAEADPARRKFQNKRVEYAPATIDRAGLDIGYGGFSAGLQYSYTSNQYADASNASQSSDGVVGLIPWYQLWDANASFTFHHVLLKVSASNLANCTYFTRRASGYPGPGIIPSGGRALYFSLGYTF